MGHLPFGEKAVVTPTNSTYVGVEFAKKLCGVSIIRSGESMENALRVCCKGIKIGKILVHRLEQHPEDRPVNGRWVWAIRFRVMRPEDCNRSERNKDA